MSEPQTSTTAAYIALGQIAIRRGWWASVDLLRGTVHCYVCGKTSPLHDRVHLDWCPIPLLAEDIRSRT